MSAVRLKLVAAVATGSVALAVAGCGSGSSATSGSGGDPASVVPASAPFYATVVVRPGGSLKDSVDSVAQKLHIADPGARIQALLAPALRRKGLDYKRDIQPWLGSRVGVFITSLGAAKGTDGAVVVAATDAAKARAALIHVTGRSGTPVALRSYRGVSYTFGSNTAAGVVGSYAVIGSEAGLRAAIDVKNGAGSLAASPAYTGALANVPTRSSIATVYVLPRNLLAAAARAAGGRGASAAVLQRLLGVVGSNAIVAAVPLDPHTIAIQASSTGSKPSTAGGGSADTLAALPGDAWLALGLGDIGAAGTKAMRVLGSLARAGLVRAGNGFNLQRDLFSWAGDTGIFVRGTSLADINVAIAIQSKNRAASRAAVPRIAALLERLLGKGSTARRLSLPGIDAGMAVTPARVPIAIDVVDGGGKFVIGLGDASVNEALHPSGRFADSAAYRTAAAALGAGVRPVFVLDFGGAMSLIDGLGLNNSPSVMKVLPYLRALSTLAVGVGHSGTRTLVHAALGLR